MAITEGLDSKPYEHFYAYEGIAYFVGIKKNLLKVRR